MAFVGGTGLLCLFLYSCQSGPVLCRLACLRDLSESQECGGVAFPFQKWFLGFDLHHVFVIRVSRPTWFSREHPRFLLFFLVNSVCHAMPVWQSLYPSRLLKHDAAQWLADRSFSIYLLHPIVIEYGKPVYAFMARHWEFVGTSLYAASMCITLHFAHTGQLYISLRRNAGYRDWKTTHVGSKYPHSRSERETMPRDRSVRLPVSKPVYGLPSNIATTGRYCSFRLLLPRAYQQVRPD